MKHIISAVIILGLATMISGCQADEWPDQPDWSKIPEKTDPTPGPDDPVNPDEGDLKPLPATNFVVAHRGGAAESGLPDNSIAGLRYCIEAGIYGCECDVYYTKDNDVIVAHANSSYQINGLTPWDHTVAEIRKAGKLANGENVPTLRDLLEVAVDKTSHTKLFLDIKKLDANHLNYIVQCAKRVSEIVVEAGASNFVTFLCTGTNDNVMKSAKTYAESAGCDYQVNTGKTTSQLGVLGLNWGNYTSASLTPEFGGTGKINPRDFAPAGMYISMFFVDKKKYNDNSIADEAMVNFYIANRDLFRTICSNYPVWLANKIDDATRVYDGISSVDDFNAFAATLASDPTAARFLNSDGKVVLKNDLKINSLSPLPPFQGEFDGGGKTINYTYSGTSGSAEKVGLFTSVRGKVSNLNVSGSIQISGGEGEAHVGSIAAEAYAATFTDCNSNVLITALEDPVATARCLVLGGLVGKEWEGCSFVNCMNGGAISYEGPGYTYMAGIIAAMQKDEGKLTFSNCKSLGNLTLKSSNATTSSHVGGFVALAQNSKYLLSEENGLVVSGCDFNAKIDLAGISGARGAGIATTVNVDMLVENCSIGGSIDIGASDIERIVAGVCAYQQKNANHCLIKNCTLSGKIKHLAAGLGKAWVGGMIGSGFHASAVIDGCVSTSDAYVGSLVAGSVGMMAGRPNYAMTVKNCKIAGTINKLGVETVITKDNIEDWMFKGSATSAAVVLTDNGFNE